jgi:hypothetical protein
LSRRTRAETEKRRAPAHTKGGHDDEIETTAFNSYDAGNDTHAAAGIGAGQGEDLAGSILITGGTVHASSTADRSGAGIGAGIGADVASNAVIRITGGTVMATAAASGRTQT